MQRIFLACAAAAAVMLMVAYIQICRYSVARGERWAAEQRWPVETRAAALPQQPGRS